MGLKEKEEGHTPAQPREKAPGKELRPLGSIRGATKCHNYLDTEKYEKTQGNKKKIFEEI